MFCCCCCCYCCRCFVVVVVVAAVVVLVLVAVVVLADMGISVSITNLTSSVPGSDPAELPRRTSNCAEKLVEAPKRHFSSPSLRRR